MFRDDRSLGEVDRRELELALHNDPEFWAAYHALPTYTLFSQIKREQENPVVKPVSQNDNQNQSDKKSQLKAGDQNTDDTSRYNLRYAENKYIKRNY